MRRIKALCFRLKSRSGVTLVEMLLTMLILLMVTAIVAGGVPAASNAYNRVLDTANAEILLSTTVTSIRRELSSAREAPVNGSNEITYYINGEDKIAYILENSPDGIKKTPQKLESDSDDYTPMLPDSRPLVSKAAASNTDSTKGMVTSFTNITCENGIYTVAGLKIEKGNKILVGPVDLKIRAIARQETEES